MKRTFSLVLSAATVLLLVPSAGSACEAGDAVVDACTFVGTAIGVAEGGVFGGAIVGGLTSYALGDAHTQYHRMFDTPALPNLAPIPDMQLQLNGGSGGVGSGPWTLRERGLEVMR